MRILLISNNYFPYQAGVARSVHILHELLNKTAGHESLLATFDFGATSSELPPDNNVVRFPPLYHFTYKQNPCVIPFGISAKLRTLIKKYTPQLIHIHHPFLLGYSGWHLARAYKIPALFTYHTQYEQYVHYAPFAQSLARRLLHRRIKKIVNTIEKVIAPSASAQKQLHEWYGTSNVQVIPSPVEDHCFMQKKMIFSHHTKPLKMISVSRFAQEKNIPFIIDAFAQLPAGSAQLFLIGYGAYLPFLKQYAYQKLQLSPEHLLFIEKPSREMLIDYYRTADLFLFASRTETQGIALSEALAAGIPIVALNAFGTRDAVHHEVNGFLVETPAQMAHYIQYLAKDHFLHNSLSQAARHSAFRYKKEMFSEAIQQLYKTMVAKK